MDLRVGNNPEIHELQFQEIFLDFIIPFCHFLFFLELHVL